MSTGCITYYNDNPINNSLKTSIDSFSDELINLNFPIEVVKKSWEVFETLKIPIKRSKLWRIIMCYCIDKAYIELGNIQDIYEISSCLGISNIDIPKIYNKLFWNNKKFIKNIDTPNTHFNIIIFMMPEMFVEEYYDILLIYDEFPEIYKDDNQTEPKKYNREGEIEIIKIISNKFINLTDDIPQIIALSSIRFCFKRWNRNWNNDKLISIVKKMKKQLTNLRAIERLIENYIK